ncbi:MAG: GNAT family N-acetyltransferase [Bacteroidota bacterium]|nr:GNAT family N-acetyltransferase [Bacteroidota bacterium]
MFTYQLIPAEEMDTILPFWQLLNNQISGTILAERLKEMLQKGYACAGVYEGEKLIGICGIWILTKYYIGRHLEPDNVIILPEYRGKGIGEQLMEWVHAYGQSQGCVAAELNCYVSNSAGQKFWANEGYEIIGFHYRKMF